MPGATCLQGPGEGPAGVPGTEGPARRRRRRRGARRQGRREGPGGEPAPRAKRVVSRRLRARIRPDSGGHAPPASPRARWTVAPGRRAGVSPEGGAGPGPDAPTGDRPPEPTENEKTKDRPGDLGPGDLRGPLRVRCRGAGRSSLRVPRAGRVRRTSAPTPTAPGVQGADRRGWTVEGPAGVRVSDSEEGRRRSQGPAPAARDRGRARGSSQVRSRGRRRGRASGSKWVDIG